MNRTYSRHSHIIVSAISLIAFATLSFAFHAHAAEATPTFSKDLATGAKGTDVASLQSWLIGKGFSIPAGATGTFGAQTRAAVAAWQKANSVSPAAGYFGPKSRTLANGKDSASAPTNQAAAKLTGVGGYLTSFTTLGDIETTMSAGDDDTKVVGVSARATGSDLTLSRVDVQFDLSGSTGSTNLSSYVGSASLYQDGTKLATMNPSDGTYQNKVWTLRFNNVNGVIKQGHTANLYIEVTPVDTLRDGETDEDVTVKIPVNGIRVTDAAGTSDQYGTQAYQSTFSINQGASGTLAITEASDDPKATTLKADTNNTTANITLVSFNGKARYEDAYVRTVSVSLTVTGTTNVSDVVQSLSLMKGTTILSTKTVSASGATVEVDFDNLNEVIADGASGGYSVVATVRKIGTGASASAFDSGDTLQASILSGSGAWDIMDDSGYQTILSGTVVGGLLTLQQTGITATRTTTSASKSVGTTAGSGDSTQYGITFTLAAGDTDLYLSRSLAKATVPSTTLTTWATTTSSTVNGYASTAASLSASDTNAADTAGAYKIPAGSSRTFTLNVSLTGNSTGFSGVRLTGLAYGTTASFGSAYTSGLDQFKTQDVSMTTH